jgi:hypothetical protein
VDKELKRGNDLLLACKTQRGGRSDLQGSCKYHSSGFFCIGKLSFLCIILPNMKEECLEGLLQLPHNCILMIVG